MKARALWALVLALLFGAQPSSAEFEATVIDRRGNRFEVSRLTYQGADELEVWVAGDRRFVDLADVDRLRLEGEPRDEELGIQITLRSGDELRGTIYSGGASAVPHADAMGSGQAVQRFSGVTALGPFLVRLSDISEIILTHAGVAEAAPDLRATVITVEGLRLEVQDLRYRNTTRFDFDQGRKQRSQEMERLERLEFEDTAPNTELRPVTVIFRSGKVVQGTVDAGTVRLGGETDRQYEQRVDGALTGQGPAGEIRLGLHRIKQIRFKPPGSAAEEPDGESPGRDGSGDD